MEELEIEFKNMLDYQTFAHLRDHVFKEAAVIQQTNFYIDTLDEQLAHRKIALRIRDTGHSLMMTLKVPQPKGVMEYHGVIQSSLLDDEHIDRKSIPENIQTQLDLHQITSDELYIIGALSTERREVSYKEGLLVLDASHYLDTEDFELEYEVSDYDQGYSDFLEFLDTYHIEKRPSINKVQRFYSRNRKLSSK